MNFLHTLVHRCEDVLPEIHGDDTLARFSSAAGNAASRTDSGACRQEG